MKQLKKEKVKVLKVEGKKTDKAIETVSKENCFAVCTQDKELIRRLKLGGIKSVYLLLRNRKMAVI
jgi:rRNA-processing protein FCF1